MVVVDETLPKTARGSVYILDRSRGTLLTSKVVQMRENMNQREKYQTPRSQFIYQTSQNSTPISLSDRLTECDARLERNDPIHRTSPQQTDKVSTDRQQNQRDVEIEYESGCSSDTVAMTKHRASIDEII